MLARLVAAAVASLIMLGALALPTTAHGPTTPSTIQIREGGQFVHWHGQTTPVATIFRDVTIVWRWDGSEWSQAYIPRMNRRAFDLEDGDFLWVVSPRAYTITLESEPDSVLTPTPCIGGDYNRDEWGSYPPAPANATPTWTKPHDVVSSRAIQHDHHVALRDAHISGGCHWSAAMKDRFSSDLGNLNPTTQSFNASKGSRTPDQLIGIAARIIDTASEQCAYARQHRDVKEEWSLTMTATEQAKVAAWLARCRTTNGEMEAEQESTPASTSESASSCDPSYPDVCIPPPPPDFNCGDIAHRRFRVIGSDPHGFDRDRDGIGCES